MRLQRGCSWIGALVVALAASAAVAPPATAAHRGAPALTAAAKRTAPRSRPAPNPRTAPASRSALSWPVAPTPPKPAPRPTRPTPHGPAPVGTPHPSAANRHSVARATRTVRPAACPVATAPGSVTATAGATSATVTWTAADGNGSTITGYVVAGSAGTGLAQGVAPSTLTATLTGLAGGTATTVRVQAVTDCGTGAAGTSAAITPTGAPTTFASSVAASHPSAYYRLGESPGVPFGADSSGHAVRSAYGTGATLGVPGALGALGKGDPDTAVTVNGGCCVATSASVVPLYNTARSVEAWVKPLDASRRWFVGWGTQDTDSGFNVGVQGQSVIVDAYNDAVSIPADHTLADGVWHDVVVTTSGRVVSAYVDGVLLGTRTLAGTLDTTDGGQVVLGAYQNGGAPFYGGLDEVAIYPTALTAATVAAHFAASGYARPAAPSHVDAIDGGDDEAVVSWAASPATTPAINRYVVTAISSGGVRSLSTIVAGTKTAARITGLAPGTGYTFAVEAGNAYGAGPEATSPATTITGTAGPYAGTVALDHPSAYYRLGEPTGAAFGADSSGHDALLDYSRATLRTDGALLPDDIDTAATADGSCCIGTAYPSLPVHDSARSVEFWVRPRDESGRWITGYGSNATDSAFDVGIGNRTVMLSAYSDDLSFPTGRDLVDGVWHQVVVTYDTTKVSAYLDGAPIGSAPLANPLNTVNASGLVVGADLNGGAPFYGDLDELSVYPSALTAARVRAHFTASGHQPPAAVTGVTATAGTNRVTVHWTAPSSDNDPVTSYLVTAVAAGVASNAIATPATATSAVVTGLPAGTAVSVRVVAVNGYGQGAAATSAAVTPTGLATTYAGSVIASHPSAYYRLGEAAGTPIAADSSGSSPVLGVGNAAFGAPGAINTDPDTAATANGGCCLGTAQATLPGFDDPRTVEAWVKPLDNNGRWILGWGGAGGTDTGFDVGVQGSQILVSASSDDLSFQSARSLADGLWHYVVVTYDGTSARAYVDGIALGVKSFAGALDTSDESTLQLGAYSNGGGAFYGGVDEVAVYPSVLGAATVTAHFAASRHGRPGAVGALTATSGANSLAVSWSAPTTGDAVSGYLVTALKGGTVPVNAQDVPAGTTSTTLTGLPGGTADKVRVVAANGYGDGVATTSAAATPTGASSTYAGTVIANGASAYYRFGDLPGAPLAADSSGKGPAGSYSQATLGTSGALPSDPDTAVSANANCCVATALPTLPTQNSARTVEAWVRPRDTSGRWIAGWGISGTNRAFNVGVQDSNVLVSAYSDDLTIPIGRSLLDGSWHQIAVTYDGTSVRAYVDGVALPAVRTFAGALHTAAAAPLQIGSFVNGGSPYYGDLDDLSIYPTALTAAQVAAHFTASGHSVPTAPSAVTASPRANGLAVSWGASSSADGVGRYLVSALAGATTRVAKVVSGTATSATLTGLAGGAAVTVKVLPSNAYGTGPAGTSAAATPTGAAVTYSSSVLAQAPVAYYRLGEAAGVTAAADSSGRGSVLALQDVSLGNSGAIVGDGDTAANTDGGCCLGVSTTTLPKFDAARSVEAWVKPLDSYTRWFAGWGASGTDQGFNVGTAGDTVIVSGYGDDLSFNAGHTLVDGSWHHVVATYDGTAATVYVDGVSLGSRTFVNDLDTVTAGTLHVGSANNGGSPYYGGLDEVAVYPTALTAAQVTAHFSASGHRVPGAPTAVTATAQAHAVAVHWTPAAAVVDGTSSYVVTAYRGTTAIDAEAVSGTTTSTTITGLPGGTAVTVKVVARNSYGSGAAGTSAAATPTGTATTYASNVLADAPVAYYRLGDGAASPVGADSSGRAGLIAYTPSVATLGGAGALPSDADTSVSANGGCCIGSAYAPALPAYNASRTVEAWVKPTDTSGRWFLGWGANGTAKAFDVGVADASVIVAGYADDLTFPVGHTLVDGNWHQIVVVYAAGTARSYVDGVSIGVQTFATPLNTVTNGYLRLGAAVDGSSPTYGSLDDVSIYPTALSAARVSAHYAAR